MPSRVRLEALHQPEVINNSATRNGSLAVLQQKQVNERFYHWFAKLLQAQ